MNDNARKIFDILGVEPNEHFKVRILGVETDSEPSDYAPLNDIYYIDENLFVYRDGSCKSLPRLLRPLLNGTYKIVKLTNEPKKEKLRDLTLEEYKKWLKKNCSNLSCEDCVFLKAKCNTNSIGCWIKHKDAYSEKFLNQEIEVEE